MVNGQFKLSGLIKSDKENILEIRTAGSKTSNTGVPTKLTIPKRPEAPIQPKFIYNDSAHVGKAVLRGMSPLLEYKITFKGEWITGKNEPEIVDIPTKTYDVYYIREKATDKSFVSVEKQLTLLKPDSAPKVNYSTVLEYFTSLANGMEYSIDNGEWQAVTTTSMSAIDIINSIPKSGYKSVKFRNAVSEDRPTSLEIDFKLYSRHNLSLISFDSVTYLLTGTNKSMQYLLEGENTWKAFGNEPINFSTSTWKDKNRNLFVRMQPTSTNSASLSQTIVLEKLAPAPTGFQIDYLNEALTGFDSGGKYQYKLSGESANKWRDIILQNGSFNVSPLILSTETTSIDIRQLKNVSGNTTDIAKIVLPKRPSAPTEAKVIYNDELHKGKAVLAKVLPGQEYKLETESVWKDGSSGGEVYDLPESNVNCHIRNKSTQESFASANKGITILAPGGQPNLRHYVLLEFIEDFTVNMEYSWDGGEYSPVGDRKSMLVTETIDSIPEGQIKTLCVRCTATASKPASKDKVIILYGRNPAPTGLIFDPKTNILSGVDKTMQYREAGSNNSWKSISNTTLNLKSFISGRENIVIEIRYTATQNSSASKSAFVNL